MKQRGYIDFTGALWGLFIFGFLAGALVFWAIPRLWPYLKAWLHAVTA